MGWIRQPCDAGVVVDLELLATPCSSPLAPLLGSDPCCCWPSDLFNPRPGELLCGSGEESLIGDRLLKPGAGSIHRLGEDWGEESRWSSSAPLLSHSQPPRCSHPILTSPQPPKNPSQPRTITIRALLANGLVSPLSVLSVTALCQSLQLNLCFCQTLLLR